MQEVTDWLFTISVDREFIKSNTMNNINEIYQDIISNCDILLQLLSPYTATNETPEGRMIVQCRWLKEQAQEANLSQHLTPV
jgi:hypothetical protein